AVMGADISGMQDLVRQVRVRLHGLLDGMADLAMIVEDVGAALGAERRPTVAHELVPSLSINSMSLVPFDVDRDVPRLAGLAHELSDQQLLAAEIAVPGRQRAAAV